MLGGMVDATRATDGVGGTLRLVLGDQLSPEISALDGLAAGDVVLLAEVMAECRYVPHHPKKIVLVLSAMRHFAADLSARGVRVDYVRLDDPANTQSLCGEVVRAVGRHRPARIVATEPGEWRVLADMRGWAAASARPVEIRADARFLCSRAAFADWAAARRGLRMEFFYREMRRTHDVLMQGGEPLGGKWNFDAENRKRLPQRLAVPPMPHFAPDAMTREVMVLVAQRFAPYFGSVENFGFPVTMADAEAALADFLDHRLAGFGDWQDAMQAGAPLLFHSLVSVALNIGLLDPLAVCRAVEQRHAAGAVALNAAEGFIRQILGWREYVRGIYWLRMPGYATLNALDATRKLPAFYWSGETRMACLREVIGQAQTHAYAHHIQRLMVTGNFALLAGLHPDAVDEWYMVVFADAFEWVEMPNTRGMALFADGGVMGSKPYAASGAYINRMSDYCAGCAYDVKDATGGRACPFNFLYWDFIARHTARFAANPRMAMPLRTLARFSPERIAAMRGRAQIFLAALDAGETV
jgi:deoxyribodipyrimidine photolyase-related protein